MRERGYKTLGTSVIYSPQTPNGLRFSLKYIQTYKKFLKTERKMLRIFIMAMIIDVVNAFLIC